MILLQDHHIWVITSCIIFRSLIKRWCTVNLLNIHSVSRTTQKLMEDYIELHAALKSKPLQAFVATKYGINPVPYRVNDELTQCYTQVLKKLQTELSQ